MEADTLTYLTAGWMEGLTASYLNTATHELEPGPVYDTEAFSNIDPYDLYLKGPQPLVVLENPNAGQNKTLYLFRDSFGSSLAPLLAASYSKVVLIDLRYLASPAVQQLIAFEPGSEALFLYSSQILNDSSLLLVSGV